MSSNLKSKIDTIIQNSMPKEIILNYLSTRQTLTEHDSASIRRDIFNRFPIIIQNLKEWQICSNCGNGFNNLTSLGFKQCKSHFGAIQSDHIWSCCHIAAYDTRSLSHHNIESENNNLPIGCVPSDHWDNQAIKDEFDRGTCPGYSKENTITIPFLIYMEMMISHYESRINTTELESCIKSIGKLKVQKELSKSIRQKLGTSFDQTQYFSTEDQNTIDGEKANLQQRNYNVFYSSDKNSNVTGITMEEELGTNNTDDDDDNTRVKTMNDSEIESLLGTANGVQSLEQSIQNGVFLVNEKTRLQLIKFYLLPVKPRSSNSWLLIDLLVCFLSIKRIQM